MAYEGSILVLWKGSCVGQMEFTISNGEMSDIISFRWLMATETFVIQPADWPIVNLICSIWWGFILIYQPSLLYLSALLSVVRGTVFCIYFSDFECSSLKVTLVSTQICFYDTMAPLIFWHCFSFTEVPMVWCLMFSLSRDLFHFCLFLWHGNTLW